MPGGPSGSSWVRVTNRGQPPVALVLFANQLRQLPGGRLDVLRSRHGDRLYVAPVFGAIEEGLEEHQRSAIQHRHLPALQRDPDDRHATLLVEGKVVEEEVDWDPGPEEPSLAIALDPLHVI